MVLAFSGLAQDNEVTKFLGIPVDGSMSDMIRKLKEKGFQQIPGENSSLKGDFNGRNVIVDILTIKNKVSRIMVTDAIPSNKADIKIMFNNLCRQFQQSKKYFEDPENYIIPKDEDISYEMTVNNKIYEATFYQKAESDSISKLDFYNMIYRLKDEISMKEFILEEGEINVYNKARWLSGIVNRHVWFRIVKESYNKYYIFMFYDNEKNRNQSDDL